MVPMARVLVVFQTEFELKWNVEKATELDIDRSDIDAALRASFGSAASRIAWG